MNQDNKIAHLQMIQEIITRMGQNSFQIKGWAIGIMIAIFSFAGEQSDTKCILFTIVPLVIMWFLDSYYLQLERKFRYLYNDVRNNDQDKNFDMDFSVIKIQVKDSQKICYFKVLFSMTEIVFYLTCIITTILIYLVG